MKQYQNYFFDCDGVVLDSNSIKSQAFYEVALPFGKDIADSFLQYHKQNGGISRFEKIKWLIQQHDSIPNKNYHQLINQFANIISEKLLSAPLNKGIDSFLRKIPKNANKFIVSGGSQEELQYVFEKRKIAHYFNGIFGAPRTKFEIINDIGKIDGLSIFFGDSKLDFEVAKFFNFDFIFLSDLTEVENWSEWTKKSFIKTVGNFEEFYSL